MESDENSRMNENYIENSNETDQSSLVKNKIVFRVGNLRQII